MRKKFSSALFLLVSLTACESYDVKSTLGLKKPSPDEFMVISNPPLSVPPEFNLQQPDTIVSAQPNQILQEKAKEPSAKVAPEDDKFLKEFDKDHPKSQVKSSIDNDLIQNKKAKEERGVIRKTISKMNADSDPTINPVAERDRLKANAEQGKAVNDGDVKMQSKSTLERIFN